jgi:hypothetical protein
MALVAAGMRTAPKNELGDDDFNSFSTSFGCLSTASSFVTIENSPQPPASHRRRSVASSPSSSGQEFFSSTSGSITSPVTPLSAEYMNVVPCGDPMGCAPSEINVQGEYSGWQSASHGMDPMWVATEPRYQKSALPLDYSSVDALVSQDFWGDSSSSNGWHLLSTSAANLSFSRAILNEHEVASDNFPAGNIEQWTPFIVPTSPETVAPSATFQSALISSPCKFEPMTPLSYPVPAAASILSSSPCLLYPPEQMSAQEEFELAEQILEAMPITPKHRPKSRRSGGRTSRTSRTTCERKYIGSSGRIKSGASKSGMACDVIIEGNKYACEFAGCMDKNGKRKMFKRREHAKRHVDTVHLKKKQFPCWVPGCTTQPFTRSDNLTTHLKSTHGKRSVSSRNRYVSTLDPASENFDPEWRGNLDDDGYPVDDCGILQKSDRSRQ